MRMQFSLDDLPRYITSENVQHAANFNDPFNSGDSKLSINQIERVESQFFCNVIYDDVCHIIQKVKGILLHS